MITGKGLHSEKLIVFMSQINLVNLSTPCRLLMSNIETSGLISNIKIAEADKGGEGAISCQT